MLSAEQELALAARYKADGCSMARDAIVGSHLRMAASCARKFCVTDADRLDSLQDGAVGLLNALDEFDASRGVRFSSLAAQWVRRSILAGIKRRNRGQIKHDDIDPDSLFSESAEREHPSDLLALKGVCVAMDQRLSRTKRAILRGRLLAKHPLSQSVLAAQLGTTQANISVTERSLLRSIRHDLDALHPDTHRRRMRTKRGPHAERRNQAI